MISKTIFAEPYPYIKNIILVVISILIALLAVNTRNCALSLAIVITAIIIVYPFFIAILNKRIDIFEPIYLIVAYFSFSIFFSSLYQLYIADSHILHTYNLKKYSPDEVHIHIFLYSSLALIAFYLGYFSKIGKNIVRKLGRIRIYDLSFYAPKIIVILFISGLLGILLYIYQMRGFSSFFLSNSFFEIERTFGRFYLTPIMLLFPTGFFIFYLNKIGSKRSWKEKFFLFFYACLIISFFALRPSKFWLFRFIFFILVFRHYLVKKISLKLLTCFILIFLLLMPIAYNLARSREKSFQDSFTTIASIDFTSHIMSRWYAAQAFAIIIDSVKNSGLEYGRTLVDSVTWVIPRAWWPKKPFSFGLTFGNEYLSHSDLSGSVFFTPSLVGELYLNFHIIGIIIGFFLYGLIVRLVYNAFAIVPTKISLLFYAPLLLHSIHFVEGPIGGHVGLLAADLAPILFVYFLNRSFIR